MNENEICKRLHDTISDSNLRAFLRIVPVRNFKNKNLEEAKQYLVSAYHRYNEQHTPKNYNEDILQLDDGENFLKYSMKKKNSQEDVSNFEELEVTANKLIGGYKSTPEKIAGLQLKSSCGIFKKLNYLPQSLHQFTNFDSVSLPRKTVLLDSRNKISELTWNLVPFSSNQRGQVHVQGDLQQIVAVKCGSFKLPIPQTKIGGLLQNVTWFKEIRLSIQEFENQGTELVSGTRSYYHFNCKVKQDGAYLICTPENIWKPNKVISQISKLTLNFFGNTEKIIFDNDRFLCITTPGPITIVNTGTPHLLSTGDLVYVENGELTSQQGYIIAVLTSNTFEIFKSSLISEQINVYAASKRIHVELNFICLE